MRVDTRMSKMPGALDIKMKLLLVYGFRYEYWTYKDFNTIGLPKVPRDPSGTRDYWYNFKSRSHLQTWAVENIDVLVSNTMITKVKILDNTQGLWQSYEHPAMFIVNFFSENKMIALLAGKI